MRAFRCCTLVLAATAAQAGVIMELESTNTTSAVLARVVSQSAYAFGWTQPRTYTNENVAALIFGTLNPASGFVYLTNSLGAGTTPANQVAFTPFSVPTGNAFSSPFVTLFSGLTLGPGTYYLVLTGASSDFNFEVGWRTDAPLSIQADSGVVLAVAADCSTNLDAAQFNGGCGFPLSSYVPASPFIDMNSASPPIGCPSCGFNVLITGDSTATEPSSWILLITGLAVAAPFVKRAVAARYTLTEDRCSTNRPRLSA